MALAAVKREGYNVAGFFVRPEPFEIAHFAEPPQSRAAMQGLVQDWLNILEDHSIGMEAIESTPYVKLTDA